MSLRGWNDTSKQLANLQQNIVSPMRKIEEVKTLHYYNAKWHTKPTRVMTSNEKEGSDNWAT